MNAPATIPQLFTIDEIREQIGSHQYSAELLLQHAMKNIEQLEAQYATLYNAAIDGGSCLMLESGRIPGFTKRRLEKMTNVLFSLPEPQLYQTNDRYDASYSAAADIATNMWELWCKTTNPDWLPDSCTYGVLLQINDMLAQVKHCHSCSASTIKALLIDAVGKLLAAMVGSCTCGAKDPDYNAHSDICSYRLLHECYHIVTLILDEVEQAINKRSTNGENNE